MRNIPQSDQVVTVRNNQQISI